MEGGGVTGSGTADESFDGGDGGCGEAEGEGDGEEDAPVDSQADAGEECEEEEDVAGFACNLADEVECGAAEVENAFGRAAGVDCPGGERGEEKECGCGGEVGPECPAGGQSWFWTLGQVQVALPAGQGRARGQPREHAEPPDRDYILPAARGRDKRARKPRGHQVDKEWRRGYIWWGTWVPGRIREDWLLTRFPRWWAIVLVVGAGAGVFCGGCGRGKARVVSVVGSTSIQPFAELLAEDFERKGGEVRVEVQGGGSAQGLAALRNGMADIGMCSRELTKEEEQTITAIVIARDGLAVVVHRSNRVTGLTRGQIRDLFAGGAGNWREVGGGDMPVRLIMREEGSGTREAFVKLVMGKTRVSRKALVQESNGAVKELVKNDPGAIGYMSLGLVGSELKVLKVDGVEPTAEGVKAGRYGMVRPFLFVVKGTPRAEARAFIDFVVSAEGQEILGKEGLVKAR